MLKRLIKVAFITGAAHVFTIFSLKYVSSNISEVNLKAVGELDSLSNFIITLIALGLLMATVRDIAISENWKLEYKSTQQARLALSLFLTPLGFLTFFEGNYFVFFFSFVFALNGDYALYGRSLPVTASILAFLKVFLPGISLIITSFYYPQFIVTYFVISILVSQLLAGYFASKILKIPYLIVPRSEVILKYLYSLKLGMVSLAFYFLGLGLIWIGAFLYPAIVIAKAYLGIKLYVIFKGVLRMINQSFIKEMVDDQMCLKVDHLAFIAVNLFLISAIIFPTSFTLIFFGTSFIKETQPFVLLVASGLVCASFTSFTTKAMLEKKDNIYSYWATISIICSIASIIVLSRFYKSVNSIYLSLLVGELIFAIGLIRVINKYDLVKIRLSNMILILPYLVIPFLTRLILGDTILALAIAFIAYGSVIWVRQLKRFGLKFYT